jgi:hypothetical protein
VQLDNKDKYSIFKDMLYNLCLISHKVLFNTEVYHLLCKNIDYFVKLAIKMKYPCKKSVLLNPILGM